MGVLEQPAAPASAPYRRIAAELRARIASGEIRAGEKVPSVRRIAQEWGVATATAAKVLTVLREEGMVRAVPGVGTVVAAPCGGAGPGDGACAGPGGRPTRAAGALRALTRERIVRTAVARADAHGAAALSMRALAAELGVPTMALYRHVPGKDDLVALMADAAFGERGLSGSTPGDWRGRLHAAALHQWAVYRRHPWLARAMVTVPRPQLPVYVTGLMEWAMAPALGTGLEAGAALRIGLTVAGYVRGVAVTLEDGAAARRARGGGDADVDALFEFGLARLLDGLGVYVEQRREGS
ncbi:GntR family transcriptional regulator [Streptomyces hiroshimensis]|uniref:GntR family transcriptional regulator n=1 Tax=Streptomyces hiroshimensis TaxID=66424 RepID=A0ABQ2YGA7_9ACTN|nr:GntR family transcriptional regulator [Streptomyces hiroshimensis]GGX81235.1 GntR family transcriptional regulator [Streptomyces hiroshimensis]